MAIIISKKDAGSTRVVEKSAFGKEQNLQEYIHDHPESVPVYDIQNGKRLFIMAREFSTKSGPIDALGVDKDGDIYIIETKLYANPDKRRVVAQALDYGASLWKQFNDFERFIDSLNECVQSKWKCDFQTKAREVLNISEEEEEELLRAMEHNLQRGNLKFVVLMDSIDEQLKDLISYINQKSQFDIYGVELEYYRHDEYEIVIPRMHGAEVKKDIPSGSREPAKFKETVIQVGDFLQIDFDTDLKMWVKVLQVSHVSVKGKILENGRKPYPQGREMKISLKYALAHRSANDPPKLNASEP